MTKVSLPKNKAADAAFSALLKEGFVAYAVGGCVRDCLMGVAPKDIDLATDARPHDLPKVFNMKRQYDGGGKRSFYNNALDISLYPTGFSHGTWTLRCGDDTVEITTFRKDVSCDGRRATVEFATNIHDDHLRRDFTMNALYVDSYGNVHDPSGKGLADIAARKVRFVGEPIDRIQEDYLRILRYFRFSARFAAGAVDEDAAKLCMDNWGKMHSMVSGERIWDELKKILSLPNATEVIKVMENNGLGFSHKAYLDVILREILTGCPVMWQARYMAATGRTDIPYPHSNKEKDSLIHTQEVIDRDMPAASIVWKYGEEVYSITRALRDVAHEDSDVTRGLTARLPVHAQDFMDKGVKPGPKLGHLMKEAETIWLQSNLKCDKEAIMNEVSTRYGL